MKRILITGAGSGLGRALALRYTQDGAFIYVTDRHFESAEQTLALVQAAGGQGEALYLDVGSEDSVAATARAVEGLDVLINNAGVAASGTLQEIRPETWDWILNINLLGVVRGCRHFGPKLARGGHIVNIASFAGIANPPNMSAYNVSKAGVVSLSETLKQELEADGIGVTVVCPAFFQTNLMDTAVLDSERTRALVQKWMQHSKVTAADVADVIVKAVTEKRFLCLTHRDTKMLWAIKRGSLEAFFAVMRRFHNRRRRPSTQAAP